MKHGGLLNKHICDEKKLNISSKTAETVNFHFSHYKSVGTISFDSNQNSHRTRIKNTTYIAANVLSMYAKFRLHPPYSFGEEDFLTFLRKFILFAALTNQSNSPIWTKVV